MDANSKGYAFGLGRITIPFDTDWRIIEMPELSPEVAILAKQVKAVFPKVVGFFDQHIYFNDELFDRKYAIGEWLYEDNELGGITVDTCGVIIGDYHHNRNWWVGIGEWTDSLEDAWRKAWSEIETTMLEKLEQ